jgi:hypothetical protein
MKIAVVGFSQSSYDDTPWEDDSWEKWGMPWDGLGWERYTRLFEMHDPVLWDLQMATYFIEFWDGEKFHRKGHRPDDYYPDGGKSGRLVNCANSKEHKLYVQNGFRECDVEDNIGLISYPFDRVIPCVGEYFQSSIAYVLALAITEMMSSEGPHELALYGIDVSPDEEWAYQRACIEFLVGVAIGKGIKVTIPETSALLTFHDQFIKYGACMVEYTERYGNIVAPQVFKRWTLGEHYSAYQLTQMDLPEEQMKKAEAALELIKAECASKDEMNNLADLG